MRFAAIADIHGNSFALEAVIADIRAAGITDVVNLGDHFSSPLDAAGTASLLAGLNASASIAGNHDRWLVEQAPEEMGFSDRCAHDQLTPETFGWLRQLPQHLVWREEVFLCHGTPQDDNTYWLEQIVGDGVAMASLEQIEGHGKGVSQSLILCAHTHIPRSVMTGNGRLIVNPGSVGCPAYIDTEPTPHRVQAGTPDACYAIIEKRSTGWSVNHRHVPYNKEAAVKLAADLGRASWAEGLDSGWISDATFAATVKG